MGHRTSPLESVGRLMDLSFYKGKRVLVTGHTGFKGAWMCRVLVDAGAILTGYSLEAPTQPNLFALAGVEDNMTSIIGDVRDLAHLMEVFDQAQPELVLHLAAQPIVRTHPCVKSFLNVTTDKVYENKEWAWGYRENEPLDGYDPYSNSKSCSELVTHSYKSSFFQDGRTAISTARAGNVIGGGDFARDRIIPDCVRAAADKQPIIVRNPYSTRPYQHVLEPVMAYLMIAQKQYEDPTLAGWYNVGPDDCDCVTTGELTTLFCQAWGDGMTWENRSEANAPHEANFLKLDCSKIKTTFGWKPRWHMQEAIQKTVEWSKVWMDGGDVPAVMRKQIREFEEGVR